MLIPTLIGMSILIFLMLRLLPGDVVDIIAGTDAQTDSAARARLREAMGLSDPIPVQYVKWMAHLLQGDPGKSLRSGKPVGELLWRALPITAELALLAMLMATVVAIPLGVISAVKRDTPLDFVARVAGLIGLSLPGFWIATLLLLFTSRAFHWVPPIRFISPQDDFFGNLKQMALPAFALAIQLMAIEMRMTRTTMLEVLNQDFVRTARAKGLREQTILWGHVLRNALVPFVTVVSIDIPLYLTGAVLVETVFSWPGMGRLFFDSLTKRDYPVLMGILILGAVLIILGNLIADLIYGLLDPRIKYA
jgi:peptide/nickel transport system permease protein